MSLLFLPRPDARRIVDSSRCDTLRIFEPYRRDTRKTTDLPAAGLPMLISAVLFMGGLFISGLFLQPAHAGEWNHIPRDRTFDVVTWNIEWFGDPDRGPDNTDLQFQNVTWVIQSLQPDLMAVQEIANADQFWRLLDQDVLSHYSGFITNYSQDQQIGFIYNTETVDSLTASIVDQDFALNSYDFAGRFPLQFIMQATVDGHSMIIFAVGIHAKAFSDPTSYNRRVQASGQIKEYFDQNITPHSALIFLGDYNDDVIRSTRGSSFPSPYKNFLDDANYTIVSQTLSEQGAESWKRGTSPGSMIDHITVNHHLSDYWLQGSEMVYVPDYISDFSNTTSDHRPVYARFDLSGTLNATWAEEDGSGFPGGWQADRPAGATLLANYPNPFNPVTVIPFYLDEPESVSLTVYNTLGQPVASLLRQQSYQSGRHSVSFDGTGLAGGVYFYRLRLNNGISHTRKMLLVK